MERKAKLAKAANEMTEIRDCRRFSLLRADICIARIGAPSEVAPPASALSLPTTSLIVVFRLDERIEKSQRLVGTQAKLHSRSSIFLDPIGDRRRAGNVDNCHDAHPA